MRNRIIPSILLLAFTGSVCAQEKVTVGENVGSAWQDIPKIPKAVVPTQPPSTAVGNLPNYSKYPIATGAGRGAFTKNYLQYATLGLRPPLRSWMGWFVWGDGLTPPGINPGIYASKEGYGKYAGKGWDFFNFQWPAPVSLDSPAPDPRLDGTWNPIRLDQQPLYLSPLVINYNWAPGLFGYESAPLQNFPTNTFYMGGRIQANNNNPPKKIVRGVNVGGSIPFFYQYGDKLTDPTPAAWRQSWLYLATRPLETTVIVPGNISPVQLVNPSGTNSGAAFVPQKNGAPDPFPYPVWRTGATPAKQTPFAILVDDMGDFHADLIWEGTNPRQSDYDTFRFYRTGFESVDATGKNAVGKGDYLKMTVAQGSPFIWCESNNNTYATFYNLIRTNLVGQIGNNQGTGAGVVLDANNNPRIFNVPGVQNVSFVLLVGDHVNPNQWYQEEQPLYATIGDGANDSNLPGGMNPPPLNGTYRTKTGDLISTTGQHNYVYTAVFFRPDEVEFPQNGKNNVGTDSQGNPYFFLQFKTFQQGGKPVAGKNWFVVGSVPEMRYYGITPDSAKKRQDAAVDWAQRMGQYAFNFVTDSKIEYAVNNMYEVKTSYKLTTVNPYTKLPAAAKPSGAGSMTNPGTLVALQPHQYQPITLGPDYTKSNKAPVVWNPLRGNADLSVFRGTNLELNANKNVKNGLKFWDYWTIRGSLDTFVTKTGAFSVSYPFQNFLPVMPPPKWEREFDQTGIAALNVTGVGTGYKKITSSPKVTVTTTGTTPGTGASAIALVDENTSQILQVNVASGGSDYPNGIPPEGVEIRIDPPPIPVSPVGSGTTATAYAQVGGGSLLAAFMKDKGFGYSSVITVSQSGTTAVDAPIIIPAFDANGNLVEGPAEIRESGAGFDFSSTNPPVATLFSGTGSGATLQIVQPGSILSYATPVVGGGSGGRYPSPDGAPPTYVKVHVPPPAEGKPAQQATAQFVRTPGSGAVPIQVVDGGLYSGTTGVYVTYTNESGAKSNQLPVTFVPSGTNFTITAIVPGNLGVSAPTPVEFFGGTVVNPPSATVNPYFNAQPVLTVSGVYSSTTGVTASFIDDATATIPITFNWGQSGSDYFVSSLNSSVSGWVTTPKEITFTGGSFTKKASGWVYPTYAVSGVVSGTTLVPGYNSEVQISFTGSSFSTVSGIRVPKITYQLSGTKKTIEASDLTLVDGGEGLQGALTFRIEGGLGFDAVLDPIIDAKGKVAAVRVIRPGSNYLPDIVAQVTGGGGSGAQLKFTVDTEGSITGVTVVNGGSGYTSAPDIVLLSGFPSGRAADPVFADNPKGVPSWFSGATSGGALVGPFIKTPPPPDKKNAISAKYYPGTVEAATTQSTASSLVFDGTPPFSTYSSANLFLANPAPAKTKVEQVLYSSIISQYFTLSTASISPFGGAYLGNSAPDGYGLGGQLNGAAKIVGDIYNMQQQFKTIPAAIPSPYAISIGKTPFVSSGTNKTWQYQVQQINNPYFTLSGALQTSVQSLQESISLLFIDPPSSNNPPADSENIWKMDYYTQFDPGVGRFVINPTATQPAWGVNSFTDNPGEIPPAENNAKKDLSRWQKGMLWSGFGVSDQWNDQHYFYGYYLGTAALAGLFDRAWLDQPSQTLAPPNNLWAGKGQMGTALDQLVMTLAFDPDNAELQKEDTGFYKIPRFTYQKFAFFDQWNGHPWATGGTPGTTVASLDFTKDPFGFWRGFGTDSDKYNGENENSIFEGVQAWSATILWGGATDRKSIVDLGMYLYSTNLAAADAYFLDKNYNLADTANNKFSWVPVTTIDAKLVPKNGGNDDPRWNAGANYASANPPAYFTSAPFFGDPNATNPENQTANEVSPGQSLLKKAENSLNNFFYAYPTGSKFIQAYPPAPWTLGMVRNTAYMKKWAGAMMRKEWNEARNSALYQSADWNAMAMTSALAGVPYNPGDMPYPVPGTPTNPLKVNKYLPRLWSSWVTANNAPGYKASLNPPFLANSVLTFLLALEEYGSPDWTYVGVATSSGGTEDPNSVVFMAAFTKEPQAGDTSVQTTFVAFNPGWNTRYAKFQRLDATGIPAAANVSGVLTVGPKKMVVKTVAIPIGN